MAEKPQLLPIGTRVTHFDGNPEYTHGKGTIVAYNGIEPNSYLQSNFKDAVEIAAGAGLLEALLTSVYDKNRCPYVVHFDLNPRKLDKYPKGYRDVYEHEGVRSLSPEESIFTSDDVNIVMRTWSMTVDEGKSMKYPKWSEWVPVTQEEYQKLIAQPNPDIEFCIRPT